MLHGAGCTALSGANGATGSVLPTAHSPCVGERVRVDVADVVVV